MRSRRTVFPGSAWEIACGWVRGNPAEARRRELSGSVESAERYGSRYMSDIVVGKSALSLPIGPLILTAGRSDEIGTRGEVREKAVSAPGPGIDPITTPGFMESCVPPETMGKKGATRE